MNSAVPVVGPGSTPVGEDFVVDTSPAVRGLNWNVLRESRRHIYKNELFTIQPEFLTWVHRIRGEYTRFRHLNEILKDIQSLEIAMPEIFDPATAQGQDNISTIIDAIASEDFKTLKIFVQVYSRIRSQLNKSNKTHRIDSTEL